MMNQDFWDKCVLACLPEFIATTDVSELSQGAVKRLPTVLACAAALFADALLAERDKRQ